MRQKLKINGIETVIPIKRSEIFKVQNKFFPGSISNSKLFLSLPCYPSLSKKNLEYIVKVFNRYN